MKPLSLFLFVFALFASAASAQEGAGAAAAKAPAPKAVFTPAPSGLYVEVRGGFAPQDLTDPNANIAYMERVGVDSLGTPTPFRRFGDAGAYAVELGLRHGRWAWGVATELQRQRVHTFAAGTGTGSLDLISLMSTMDVRAVTTYRPTWLLGFEVGGSAGLAFAHYSEQFALTVYRSPANDASVSGAFHAVSFSGGPLLGWRRPLYGNWWLTARGAWLWRDFGELEGQYRNRSSAGTEIVDEPLRRLEDDARAKIDGGGWQFTAGLNWTIRGRR